MSQGMNHEEMYIIGIGTSAGGLEALKSFFDHLPPNCPHAFVVVQHLSPDYKSLMAELLAKNTDLTIHEVTDHMTIEAGSLYLLPPRKNMTIQNGALSLTDKPKDTRLNLPIDIFFRSLAVEKGEKAIGLILTGTGSDGTRGVRAIKEVGGLVMVQDPAQAKFDGMPQSAIQTGLVDAILPVEQLAIDLLLFIESPRLLAAEHSGIANDESLLRLLHHVRNVTELDFAPYKRPTLVRRIIRRMNIHKMGTFQDYLSFLLENPKEIETLVSEFLIGVTKFFRDELVWELLESKHIPELVASKDDEDSILKCWVVGCSTGEEAYSLAILLREEIARQGKKLDVRIFATDIQTTSLGQASRGVYSASAVADVSSERLESHFYLVNGSYQVIESIRNMVVFSKHNILFDTPFSRMDFVFCRNVLIYIEPAYQSKAMTSMHYALKKGGLLVLGSSETVGEHDNVLHEVNRKARIYRNVHQANHLVSKGLSIPYQTPSIELASRRRKSPGLDELLFGSLSDIVADELGFVGVLIDEAFSILRVVGEFHRYVELPKRGFSAQLLELLPERLASVIRTGVFKARRIAGRVRYENVFLGKKDERAVSLVIAPIHVEQGHLTQFLVGWVPSRETFSLLFDEKDVLEPGGFSERRIVELENELEDSRINLKSSIEQLELSNEELQVTNEELLATNEELQSTNEELQSVNEELHTVNMEYQFKLEQVANLHAEMNNLLRSTNIGTLFLDRSMRIRRLTPAVQKQFNLEESDVGRPLSHFTGAFGERQSLQMLEQASNVLNQETPVHYELQSVKGLWYVVQIHPYYDGNKFVDGVVFSFIDISERKRAEQELREQEAFVSVVLSTQPSIVYVFDIDTQSNVFSNDGIHVLLGYSPKQIRDMDDQLFAEVIHPDDLAHVTAKEQEIKDAEDGQVVEVEYRALHADGTYRWLRSYERVFKRHPDGSVRQKLGVSVDETEARRANAELNKNEARLQTVLTSMPATITIMEVDGTVLYVNRCVDGINRDDYIGSSVYQWLPPSLGESLKANVALVVEKKETVFFEDDFTDPTGVSHHFYHVMSFVPSDEGEDNLVIVSQEITDLKTMEKELRIQRDQLAASNKELEQFAYITAHDLQEPLRTVSGFAGLLAEEYTHTLDEAGQEMLRYLTTSADRMSLLIRSLLDYSLIGKERVFEEVDCHMLLEEIISDLGHQIGQTNAQIEIGELPVLSVVKTELRVLLQNLLGNALKFSREGVTPCIAVSAEETKTEWRFFVKDNGIGIEESYLDKIFLIFQRLHPTGRFEGAGIGLAHCAKVVALYGGQIWAESTPGEGSTFSFSLPKASFITKSIAEEGAEK